MQGFDYSLSLAQVLRGMVWFQNLIYLIESYAVRCVYIYIYVYIPIHIK